jgi:prophage maintenance system killer protein
MGEPPRSVPPAWPTYDQTVAFHHLLMERLGLGESGVASETKLKAALDRALQAGQGQRGDLVMLAAFILFNMAREKPFVKGNAETAVALAIAFLLRNGGVVAAPDEEVAGVGIGVSEGGIYVGMVEQWLRDSVRRLQ